jgi:hypothetical protein
MEPKDFRLLDRSTNRLVPKSIESDTNCVALCFKVPFQFRQRFKLHALQRSMTMTNLLIRAIESYVDDDRPAGGAPIKPDTRRAENS